MMKLVMIGETGSGKTSIVQSLVMDADDSPSPTLGIDYYPWQCHHAPHAEETVRLQVWDTSGERRFVPIIRTYLRHTSIIVLVYADGHGAPEYWLEKIREFTLPTIPIVVLHNTRSKALPPSA